MIFDHWELVEYADVDAFDPATKTYQCIMDTRKRKGMKVEMPVCGYALLKCYFWQSLDCSYLSILGLNRICNFQDFNEYYDKI